MIMEIIWSLWLSFMTIVVVRAINWIHRWRNPKCNGKLPPGSMGLPLIGETLNFLVTSNSLDVHPFVKERMERYGPLFKTSIAGRPVVVSLNPEFNYYVLQQEEKLVEIDYMDAFFKLLDLDSYKGKLGGYLHKYVRRAILGHFGIEALKKKLLYQFEVVINHELHEWTKQPMVDIRHQTNAMLFDLASSIVMGCKLEENFGEDLHDILQGLMRFPLYIPGTAFYNGMKKRRRAIKQISKLVEERMKKHSDDPKASCNNDKGNFLDQIVGDIGKEAFMTKEFVSHFVFALLIATVVNIATAITLLTKYLLDNPSAFQQLTEEHEEILKNREDVNSGLLWTEYKSMTFTHYVINESLRLSNILGILRRVITDIHVDGYTIPKDWILFVVPTVHLNPDIYEDPLSFNPSRWKNIGGTAMVKNFIPFGGGSRTCAGADFTKVILAVFLHAWVTKYRLTKLKGGDVVRAPLLDFTNQFYINVSEKCC